jgi:hypothetical protein
MLKVNYVLHLGVVFCANKYADFQKNLIIILNIYLTCVTMNNPCRKLFCFFWLNFLALFDDNLLIYLQLYQIIS